MDTTHQTIVVLMGTRALVGTAAVKAGRMVNTEPGLLHADLASIQAQIDHCLALWGETNTSVKVSED